MTTGDDLRERVLAAVAAQPARTRAQGHRRALAAYAAVALALTAIFEAAGGVAHASARPAAISQSIAAGTAVLAVVATWGALGAPVSGRRATTLAALVALLPLAAFAWLAGWHGTYVEPADKFGWRCLALTTSMGALVLASVVFVRRGTVAVRPTLEGAAAGVAGGAIATVLVDAWCPLTNAAHVLHGHVAPMVALGVVGAACGKWLLAVRAR